MQSNDLQIWLAKADAMIVRLERLNRAVKAGRHYSDPNVAVTNAEVRSVDMAGLEMLRVRGLATRFAHVWYVHAADECAPIDHSIARIECNGEIMVICSRQCSWCPRYR